MSRKLMEIIDSFKMSDGRLAIVGDDDSITDAGILKQPIQLELRYPSGEIIAITAALEMPSPNPRGVLAFRLHKSDSLPSSPIPAEKIDTNRWRVGHYFPYGTEVWLVE